MKGHHDDSISYDELDIISQANVDVESCKEIARARLRIFYGANVGV